MVCFVYEVGWNGNDGLCQIVVWMINVDGVKIEEVWYEVLFCGMIYDCGILKNYVVFFMIFLKCLLDWFQKGGNYWVWDLKED